MKLTDREILRFAKQPDPRIRAVLLYGPDDGRAREIARSLVAAVAGQPPDPFRYAELTGAKVKDEAAALADEAGQLSFSGGRRVVWVRGTAAEVTAACTLVLEGRGEALVVVEAGDIDSRSALRRMFEEADDAAAFACYHDEGRALGEVIRETLAGFKVRAGSEVLGWLEARLGGDRGLTRAEIEKLALYVGPGNEATLADAQAVVGDSADIGFDDMANALAEGDIARVERTVGKLLVDGESEIAILRLAQRHFLRLHLAAGHLAAGRDERTAMNALRPPVFFKDVARFRAQLSRWRLPAIEAALSRLLAGEIEAKSGRVPQDLATRSCLLAVARIVAR